MPPRWIAHRGLSADFPENGHAAFTAARAAGCHGIETDVQLDRYGAPVLVHDRLGDADASGLVRLHELLREFDTMDLLLEAKLFHPDERPPLLAALLAAVQDHLDHVFLLCFDLAFLEAAHAACPDLRCVLNLEHPAPATGRWDFLHALSSHIDYLTPDFAAIDTVHMAWTCNSAAQREKALALHVDYILSDHPPPVDR